MNILELMMKFLRGALNFIFEILDVVINGSSSGEPSEPPKLEEPEDFKYNWRTGEYDMGEDLSGWYDDD